MPDTFSDTPELPDTLPDTVVDTFNDFSKSYTRLDCPITGLPLPEGKTKRAPKEGVSSEVLQKGVVVVVGDRSKLADLGR